MEVKLNLEYELLEPIVVAVLKEQYELLLKTAPLGFNDNEAELSGSYKVVLEDFMGHQAFQKYAHDMAKKNKKYDSKKLVEANNGL
jgi:hypothetical protein